ncbi:hypothetical protein [Methylobacterium sp. A54F]
MRILRPLLLGATIGAGTLVIGFVSVDRLTQAVPERPRPARPAPEPSATGSIAPAPGLGPEARPGKADPKVDSKAEKAAAKRAQIPNGFDTERLNALMRGDPILPQKR